MTPMQREELERELAKYPEPFTIGHFLVEVIACMLAIALFAGLYWIGVEVYQWLLHR